MGLSVLPSNVPYSLNTNNIGAEVAKAFASALRINISLRHLSCVISIYFTRSQLFKCLNVVTFNLLHSLYNNKIGDEGAKALASALRINMSLGYLMCDFLIYITRFSVVECLNVVTFNMLHSLPNNNIGDEGAKALASALRVNKSLRTLKLLFFQIVTLLSAVSVSRLLLLTFYTTVSVIITSDLMELRPSHQLSK